MRKKLFSVILVIIMAAAALVILNAEALCKKYIFIIEYPEYVERYAQKNGLDKYLVYAMIKTESGFDSSAVSDVGARGLMQLMEDAFDWVKYRMGDERDIDYDDMFIPEYNIEYGCYLYTLLYEEYGDVETALAAYYMGRGTVNRWLENEEYSSDGVKLDTIPSASAQHYVNKVMTAYSGYTNLYTK